MSARPPFRVLLVDDDRLSARLAARHLQALGGEVTYMDAGGDAVTRVMRDPDAFDIAFIDLEMPQMTGYSAAQLLREQGFAGPVVAISAGRSLRILRHLRAIGCHDFVAKPFTRAGLAACLDRVLPHGAEQVD